MPDLRSQIQELQRLSGLTGRDVDGIVGPQTVGAAIARIKALSVPGSPETLPDPPDAEIDTRTAKNLATLEPAAQKKFRPFILRAKAIAASLGCEYVAISGTRGEAEQNALYAKGRTAPGRKVTNARYGYSNHNFGIALDFGVFRSGKYLDSSDPGKAEAVHRAVAAIAGDHGIDWGGNWRSFKDIPHFEVSTPLSAAEKRKRLFAGQPILA